MQQVMDWIDSNHVPDLVSVIIATYNRRSVLAATLKSVVMQDYRPIELIVVDDGSTDGTDSLVRDLKDQHECDMQLKVSYVRQTNAGQPAALNRGVVASSGEYIQFLDSDDLLGISKLSAQIRTLHELPERTIVFSSWRYFEQYEDRYDVFEPHRSLSESRTLEDWLGLSTFAPPHSLLWRRSDVARTGPWDGTNDRNVDGEYAMRYLLRGGRMKLCPSSWVYYRNWPAAGNSRRTNLDRKALLARVRVVKKIERALAQNGTLDDYRGARARHYAWLAERAVPRAPVLADCCYARARALCPEKRLNSGFLLPSTARVLGFSRSKRLYRSVKRVMRMDRGYRDLRDSMAVVDSVSSLESLLRYDCAGEFQGASL